MVPKFTNFLDRHFFGHEMSLLNCSSDRENMASEADPGEGGLTAPPPRTAQLIVKFGEKVLQIDYRCCK